MMRRLAGTIVMVGGLVWAGCVGGLVPVARSPWVEDSTTQLAHELLVLRVEPDCVQVDAHLTFVLTDDPRDRTVTFPVGKPSDGVREMSASFEVPGLRPRAMTVYPASEGVLPTGPSDAAYDIAWPAAIWSVDQRFARQGTLTVHYRQRALRRFDYILETGAYWAGPIGELVVRIEDAHHRLSSATVQGRPAHRSDGDVLLWHFVAMEPTEPVTLHLR